MQHLKSLVNIHGRAGSRSGWNMPVIVLAFWVAGSLMFAGCTTLPRGYPRTVSTALADTRQTRLRRWVAPLMAEHPAESGVHPLRTGMDAFVARVALADVAERSLDVQYFIWHADTTGKLLAERLLRAADRGVRVRLLLDDLHTASLDRGLGALDQHPNIEIRIFNPFGLRDARILDFLSSFARLNRRMHNKSFTADNQATVVGGRNVGDEYFGAGTDLAFRDLDLLAVGPVVPQVSAVFDEYWNSEFAVPLAVVTGDRATPPEIDERRAALARHTEETRGSAYGRAAMETDMAAALATGVLPFFWGRAQAVFDRPAKAGSDPTDRATHLGPQLWQVVEGATSEVILVSPYFVPGEGGVALLSELRRRGVRVEVVTNSLASSDVPAVHAGYAPHREDLLQAGVELYELKPTAFERGRREKKDDSGSEGLGSGSRAGLHAKTFVVDRRVLFVGSFNLDPRSGLLNTEMGILVESPALAESMANALEQQLPEQAFRLELWPGSTLEWVTREGGEEVRFDAEPFAGFWRRLEVRLLSLLPIKGQL
jgi:putative cardiolipin synthase